MNQRIKAIRRIIRQWNNARRPFAEKAQRAAFDVRALLTSPSPGACPKPGLAEALRSEIGNLEPIADDASAAGSRWVGQRRALREQIAGGRLEDFLRWNVIQDTMFHDPDRGELETLRMRSDWVSVCQALVDSPIGYPYPYFAFPESGGNLIHLAYNLGMFSERFSDIASLECIVEFGGGYGGMCRLAHALGFKGTYIIFDLPEFSHLQEYYLRSAGVASVVRGAEATAGPGITLVDTFDDLAKAIETSQANQKKSLLIATWSLSEAPVDIRERFLAIVHPQNYLLAYQQRFGEVDNAHHFGALKQRAPGLEWSDVPAPYLRKDAYLVGRTV